MTQHHADEEQASSTLEDTQRAAEELVAQARHVVVLSGAGMSAESGVPTFRDAQTGLWERFDATQLATEEAFRADPPMVWTWYVWRGQLVRGVEPNAGHLAITRWQNKLTELGGRLTVATQNVDDLHERAGTRVAAHLHGDLFAYRCLECGTEQGFDPESVRAVDGTLNDRTQLLDPVSCSSCSAGVLRPGVVWFGEALPEHGFGLAIDAIQEADLILVVGSSGMVQPAASLPLLGLDRGVPVIEINPQATELSSQATIHLETTAAHGVPEILAQIETR